MVPKNILVTGGAGYIGSHTALQLLQEGFHVVVVDNLVNSSEVAIKRVAELAGCAGKNLAFHRVYLSFFFCLSQRKIGYSFHLLVSSSYSFPESFSSFSLMEFGGKVGGKGVSMTKNALQANRDSNDRFLFAPINNSNLLAKLNQFDAVIHFAGLKAVGESVQKPLLYYNNNLIGTITLLETMSAHGCKNLIFSSSATVYGWPKQVPCTEEFPLSAANPYGRTKLVIEDICRDIQNIDANWKIILLRYFNPVGAHPSGYIGEDPHGIPNNLMPYIQQVAVGRRPSLTVFGTDYNTKDGTGVRDYIHIMDLADGHIAALRKLFHDPKIGCEVYNLGTGKGTTVLEMVAAFEKACGKKIPLVMAGRRPGDAEIVYASTEKAARELNWRAKYGIEEMCRDQWNWASKNPWGYGSPESET
ncbi:hypothetical protein HPP92_012935 [Vanilla planifolia]|uniref:UDP-glucose 4-epimerase n=1 Tax=Vanilla planifolia TaxID=51239 RepID=A0A835QW55_VANPL|nr:hypothetical protein HPP92_012935 [Vanilla planifolia]